MTVLYLTFGVLVGSIMNGVETSIWCPETSSTSNVNVLGAWMGWVGCCCHDGKLKAVMVMGMIKC